MLKFVITYSDSTQKTADNVLTAVINAEEGVPADDLTITLPFDGSLSKNAERISVFDGDEEIFTGQTDEIINIKNSDGAITKITARSPAGQLLDNEAEPLTYVNPDAEYIWKKHLEPFGIKSFEADSTPFYGNLSISKGMTHWQVFYNYCINRYGHKPRITGDGKAYFTGFESDEKVIFSESETAYCSLKENLKRCRLISEVKLKLSQYKGYTGSIKNLNPECENISRVRYVNAVSDKTNINTADNIISQSNSDSYSITLECHGCHIGLLGRKAQVCDDVFGTKDDLIIRKIKYTLGKNGENTTVTLGKEKF